MSKETYTTSERSRSRPALKLSHLPKTPPRLRLGGMEPSADMQPGKYKVSCEGASKKPFGLELKYRVIDGPHTGVGLRQWITTDASGVISPRSRYAQQCATALGRPLDAEDDLNDPASIFAGRHFLAFVAFRKTEKPRGGRILPADDWLRRKDSSDGLRVHDLLRREEL